MRIRSVAIGCLIALGIVSSAVVSLDLTNDAIISHQRDTSVCPHDKDLKTYEEWTETVSFPYISPREKLDRVKENYSHVDVGSPTKAVIEAFGPPDFERELIPKEPWRPCLGHELAYYFSMLDAGNDNEIKDKRIEVFLNVEGKVDWISGNVGLPEKGSYAVHH